jgi:hypothetical protein
MYALVFLFAGSRIRENDAQYRELLVVVGGRSCVMMEPEAKLFCVDLP